MSENVKTLSEQLLAVRNRMADSRHGGLVLTGEDLEETIGNFTRFARLARELEAELSRSSHFSLAVGQGAVVLNAMRPTGRNVVPFPGPGGSTA